MKINVSDEHPCRHPLWFNKNSQSAFRETLRYFRDNSSGGRLFHETELWLLWYETLKKCLQ